MATTIKLKAVKNAPEQIAHGNFTAELKRGHYETENRRFADHIIASGYAVEVDGSSKNEAEGGTE